MLLREIVLTGESGRGKVGGSQAGQQQKEVRKRERGQGSCE